MHNIESVDLSKYNTIFCDSVQALEWAYNNGLSKSATIKSSSPAVLLSKKINTCSIEDRWTIEELGKFQGTIKKMTEDVFDAVLSVTGAERELALAISKSAYHFQSLLYKAACLDESDFNESRLFIYVDGKTGPAGNMMNSPWDQLLMANKLFSMVNYKLKNDEWKMLTTQGISYWQRFKVAGIETVVYRLAVKLMRKLPNWIFTKEILIPNESELNIEVASSLALHGVRITEIQVEPLSSVENILSDVNTESLYKVASPIMRERVEEWVSASAIDVVMDLFKSDLEKQLNQFKILVGGWENVIATSNRIKRAILINSPGNIKGQALAYVCRKKDITLISSQHGVTIEISRAHSMLHVGFDNSVADIMLSYNTKIVDIEKNIYFDKSRHYTVGMPLRLIRMKNKKAMDKSIPPIVYVSSNEYMGFSVSQTTDYANAKAEQNIVTEVLGRLPYKIRYKTYPLDNRRFPDMDPVLSSIEEFNNIEVYSDKIDMRYLISEHRVIVTSQATSTLGWLVMSGKPVVFINKNNNSPLTDDAYQALSKGLFVFDDNDKKLHEKLRYFLSKPINEIENAWENKKTDREIMIRNYFSAYNGGAGKLATQIILKECFM